MKTIRKNTFETNSSSCHCMTIVRKEVYDDWRNGKYAYDSDIEKLIPISEVYESSVVKRLFEETILPPHTFEDFEKAWVRFTKEYCYNYCDKPKDLSPLEKTIWSKNFYERTNLYSFANFYLANGLYDGDVFEEDHNIDGNIYVAFGYYGRDG